MHSKDGNTAYLYINDAKLDETYHGTYSETGQVDSTGGRVVTVEASAGDKIEIRADKMDHAYYLFLYCAEYIARM